MATIRVTREDAIKVFESNLYEDERYEFGKLAEYLREKFPEINNSQISGMIHRLSSGKNSFLSKYQYSDVQGYRYELNPNWNNEKDVIDNSDEKSLSISDLNIIINKKIDDLIDDINLLKSKASDVETFEFIQKKIDKIEEIKKL